MAKKQKIERVPEPRAFEPHTTVVRAGSLAVGDLFRIGDDTTLYRVVGLDSIFDEAGKSEYRVFFIPLINPVLSIPFSTEVTRYYSHS